MSGLIKYDKSKVRVLVVDDETSIREMLCIALKDDGWNVDSAENGRVAFEKIQKSPYHIVISDVQMPEMTGTDLLEATKKNFPLVEFLIMTSNATLESAVKAVKLGAYDYLNKPFEDISVVPNKIAKVADKILLRQQNQELIRRLRKSTEDLKLLFETTSELNSILDTVALYSAALAGAAKILRDPATPAAVFEARSEGWERILTTPSADLFPTTTALAKNVNFSAAFPDRKSLRVTPLEYGEETKAVILIDGVGDQVLDVFLHEVSTSFKKVMLHQDILSMAHRDGLTRLYNHRYFQDRLRQELSQVKRQGEQLSLIILDVDHFKSYNDKHGHPAGDLLLKELARLLDKPTHRRDSDIVARYGGEEFVIILPFTPFEGAMLKAERLREAIAQFDFPHKSEQPLGCVSVSVGVASFPEHAEEPTELIELADKALYRSKQQGRNRVTGADQVHTLKKILETTSPTTVTKPVVEKPTLGEVLSPVEEKAADEEFTLPSPDELLNQVLIPQAKPKEPEAPQQSEAPVETQISEQAEPPEPAAVQADAEETKEAEVPQSEVKAEPTNTEAFDLPNLEELFKSTEKKETPVEPMKNAELPPPPSESTVTGPNRKQKNEAELTDLLSSIEQAYLENEAKANVELEANGNIELEANGNIELEANGSNLEQFPSDKPETPAVTSEGEQKNNAAGS